MKNELMCHGNQKENIPKDKDNNIEIKASIALSEVERLEKFANVDAISVNGIVLLVGQVANQEMKNQAQQSIEGLSGIRKYITKLELAQILVLLHKRMTLG